MARQFLKRNKRVRINFIFIVCHTITGIANTKRAYLDFEFVRPFFADPQWSGGETNNVSFRYNAN